MLAIPPPAKAGGTLARKLMDGFNYGVCHMYAGYEIIGTPEAFDPFVRSHFGNNPTRLIFGHRHRQDGWWMTESRAWISPGSLSYRREDDPGLGAQYATIEDGHTHFKCETYDMRPICEKIVSTPIALEGYC